MQQTSFSPRELEHYVLSSLRDQDGVNEILDTGFVAGVEHDGVIVGVGETGVPARVFLEVTSRAVINHTYTIILLDKLSRLQESEKLPEAKCLLIYTGSITDRARQNLEGTNVIARSLRSLEDLRTQFWKTLRLDYAEPSPVGRAQQLIQALDNVPLGARHAVAYEGAASQS